MYSRIGTSGVQTVAFDVVRLVVHGRYEAVSMSHSSPRGDCRSAIPDRSLYTLHDRPRSRRNDVGVTDD